MANIEELKHLEERGKILEKQKKIREWKSYNRDIMKLNSRYAQERHSEITASEDKRRDDMTEDFADRVQYLTGRKKVYSVSK